MRMKSGVSEMKKRLTIGLMDEDAYDEYHTMIAEGVRMSAKKYNINIIRFGHFLDSDTSINPFQEGVLHKFIKQFDLDGLLFLGWARAAHNTAFCDVFADIPMTSFGSSLAGIPSVIFHGQVYIEEILHHLIHEHGMKKIAFISPVRADSRRKTYLRVMKECDLFDPQLLVSENELTDLSVDERGRRAVEILLDERRIRPEAIVSLYNEETYEVIKTLNARGLRVPEDIAVTSYEDGEMGRFSTPGFTTVYFPWKELGYYGCETLYSLITKASEPLTNHVMGKVIYRNSCGCIPSSARRMKTGRLEAAEKRFDELNECEMNLIAEGLAVEAAITVAEMRALLDKFTQAVRDGSSQPFLREFEEILRKSLINNEDTESGRFAVLFREKLMPWFLPYAQENTDIIVRVENLFHQMQVLLQSEITNAWFREDIRYNNVKLTVKEVGQILITHFNPASLMDSIETILPRVGVNSCYIYLFGGADSRGMFDNHHLEFEYREGRRIRNGNVRNKNRSFEEVLFEDDKSHFLLAHLLYIGNDFIGFIIFDPLQSDLRIYRALGLHISTALNGVNLFEKLDASYRRLMIQARRRGMEDSTGILHNIANIMNSVNVTTQSIEKLMTVSAVNDLRMANEMLKARFEDLEDFIKNDPKGKKLMQYYVSIGESFEDYQQKLQTYISRLTDKVGLIEGIINEQQSFTAVRSSLEELDLVPIVNDVLKMYQTLIDRLGIRVVRTVDDSAVALVQRTKLFHVLTNIIKNGIESMEKMDEDGKTLTVSVYRELDNVFIRICDSGPGISAGNLESIFAYGFTTKKDGHGFGLHSCANYMTEMKGRIWAEHGEGGRGAVFVMQFMILPGV